MIQATDSEPNADGVDIVIEDRTASVRLRGEIDLLSRDTILAQITGAIPAVSAIELSLASVTFIDSSGIGMLLRAQRAATEAGVAVRVVDTTPALEKLFTTAGISEVFKVESEAEAAVDAGGTPVDDGVEGPNSL